MDPRQPPSSQQQSVSHPFSRNTVSPYNRTPFPPTASQASFPPSSHPPSSTPTYAEHQRRPSDPPFYNAQRVYGQDGPSQPGLGHVRHQSASSISNTPVNRGMPPPSSPQQERQQYGPPRAQLPGAAGFGGGRELPALGQRSGMSISDILGGPAVSREPAPQYGSPVSAHTVPTSLFGRASGSPRNQSTGPEYTPFRRPQTPELQRLAGPRDHRANSAGSPPNPNIFGTPENRQFGTPYRGGVGEDRRDGSNAGTRGMPPRPNSQPTSYNPPPSRTQDSRAPLADFTRRIDHIGRPAEQPARQESQYARSSVPERQEARYPYLEQEQQEREKVRKEAELREQESRRRDEEMSRRKEEDVQMRREQDLREREARDQERRQEYANQLAQRNAQAYSQAQEREAGWNRSQHAYEPFRSMYDQRERAAQHTSSGYDYPGTSAPPYSGVSAYAAESRQPHSTQTSSQPPLGQHESLLAHERQRRFQLEQDRQQQGQYPYSNESPIRRSLEDAQQMQQQKSFLGVQEINRKGRLSPLPQAVQGAQSQPNGPVGEPSIKNEFGRMFSGIGSGASILGAPSPVNSGPPNLPFTNAGQVRREESEAAQNSPVENGAPKMSRTASMGSRRRKLKDEEGRPDDEGSTGRRTPSGRAKRPKGHHHHHHTHHHHHHHTDGAENASSPVITPFKNTKGASIPSPLDKESSNLHHHHVPLSRPHHHHHHVSTKTVPQINPQIPLPNITIVSNAVLDSVKGLPRRHLGHSYYDATLKRTGHSINGIRKGTQGYSSTPKPLPLFEEDQYNCTHTIKVPRINLTKVPLQEITNRKALWGTDIYTDDSDVIAAAIHAGWFRGAWDASIDTSLLGLELHGKPLPKIKGPNNTGQVLEQPPPEGPADIPANHDVHIDVIVLPLLEGYSSTIRFGIKSREWGFVREGHKAQHDGLSFMIHKVTFVTSDTSVAGIRTRKKIAQQKSQAARTAEERRLARALKDAEPTTKGKQQFEESFERGGPGPLAYEDMKGIGTNSWWQPPKPRPPSPVRQATPPAASPSHAPVASQEQRSTQEDDDFDPDTTIENTEDAAAQPQQQDQFEQQEQRQEPPRTPPRRSEQPPRGYVPLDPPIPSPISVFDSVGEGDRTAEMSGGESLNVTPVKAVIEASERMEDVVSPPRAIPDVVSSPIKQDEDPSSGNFAEAAEKPAEDEGEKEKKKEIEVISANGGFGGDIEVKREVAGAESMLEGQDFAIVSTDVPRLESSATGKVVEEQRNGAISPSAPEQHAQNERVGDIAMEDAPSIEIASKELVESQIAETVAAGGSSASNGGTTVTPQVLVGEEVL